MKLSELILSLQKDFSDDNSEFLRRRKELAERWRKERSIDLRNRRVSTVVSKNRDDVPLAIRNLQKLDEIKMKLKAKDLKLKNINVIKAPESTEGIKNSVFLAGSIEMGKAIDWQTDLAMKCEEQYKGDSQITFLNPRRDDWDSSWKQEIGNKQFREQVEWELDSMEKADKIVIFFDKDTKSPITLMELGLHAKDKKMCVCCPEGFFRKGNVDIVCKKYNIPMVDDIDGLVKFILDE